MTTPSHRGSLLGPGDDDDGGAAGRSGGRPRCMTADEMEDWLRANRRAGAALADWPCEDCTATFAAEMRAEGRCDGRPGH